MSSFTYDRDFAEYVNLAYFDQNNQLKIGLLKPMSQFK